MCLDPKTASVALAKLQNPVKQSFDSVNTDLKEVYKALGNYSKALDKARVPRSLNSDPLVDRPFRNSKTSLCRLLITMLSPHTRP